MSNLQTDREFVMKTIDDNWNRKNYWHPGRIKAYARVLARKDPNLTEEQAVEVIENELRDRSQH